MPNAYAPRLLHNMHVSKDDQKLAIKGTHVLSQNTNARAP